VILGYFPTVGPPDAERLDPGITGVDLPLADVRARVAQINHHLRWGLELGSTYHGLRDPTAQCSLEYDIVKTVEYLEALPVSDFPGYSPGVFRPDYRQILVREGCAGSSTTWVSRKSSSGVTSTATSAPRRATWPARTGT
jgi:hypothetical protein